jgi:uncharacterized protein YajQ (UPF0234 family)
MAKDASFDVVSEFDQQELTNALDQARRDIASRYDLKDTATEIEVDSSSLTVTTANDMALRSVLDLLREKLTKRGLSPYVLDTSGEPEAALGGRVRLACPLKAELDKDEAKQVAAAIKALKLKVQASIQGETVRVSGKSRDDLQVVISHLKEKMDEWSLPLQFKNYR